MAIDRLLKNHAFGPDEIRVLTIAYEEALRTLRLKDRADPATEMIAKKIIELAQRGERDPARLRDRRDLLGAMYARPLHTRWSAP